MTKNDLRKLVQEVISEASDYDKMTPQQKRQYGILRDTGWEYDYMEDGVVYMNRWDRGSDGYSKLATMVIKPDGEHYRQKGNTNENYEDGIKDAKDRMAYLALRKQEKDYISKSKQSSSPIKKQHYMDMSKQVLDKALDILKKHKVVDEMYSDTSYKTQKGYDAAKKKIQALKDELKRIQDLKNKSDYNDTNDPQARNYHDRRLKEIPKLISAIKQKVLGLKQEANTKELQKLGFKPVKEAKGYVLGPMDQESTWIAWNKKPKNKNGKQMWVVSAADFQKQFPNIQMKELPAKPSSGADYYIVDSEGDLFPYSQANIGSGLD